MISAAGKAAQGFEAAWIFARRTDSRRCPAGVNAFFARVVSKRFPERRLRVPTGCSDVRLAHWIGGGVPVAALA